jgi:hypothetical protein
VIIHYVKSKIVAFSRARTDGGPCTVSLAAHYPFTPTHCWYGHNPDWYFETEYYDLAFPIPRDTFNQQLARLKTDAVLSNGNVRQAYFIPFRAPGDPAVQIIGQAINPQETLPDWARAAFGLAPTPQTSASNDHTRPIPPPVPLMLDPALLPAWQRRIEQRHRRYQDVRETIARSLNRSTSSDGTQPYQQREIEQLDTRNASILATMTERAQKDTTELNAMSRSDLISELVHLRELARAYDQVATTGWQSIACLTGAVEQSLYQQHPELKTALSNLHRALNELSLVEDELEAASHAHPDEPV